MTGLTSSSRIHNLFEEVIDACASIISYISLPIVGSIAWIAGSTNRTKQTSISTLTADIACVVIPVNTKTRGVIGVKGKVKSGIAAKALKSLVILVIIARLTVIQAWDAGGILIVTWSTLTGGVYECSMKWKLAGEASSAENTACEAIGIACCASWGWIDGG